MKKKRDAGDGEEAVVRAFRARREPPEPRDEEAGQRERHHAERQTALRENLKVAVVGESRLVHLPRAVLRKGNPIAAGPGAQQRMVRENPGCHLPVAGAQGERAGSLIRRAAPRETCRQKEARHSKTRDQQRHGQRAADRASAG